MKTILTLLGALTLLLCSSANAGVITCSQYATDNGVNDVTNNLQDNVGCNVGTTNNDFVSNPLQVNQDMMFGYDDWLYGIKFDYDTTSFEDGLLSFTSPTFNALSMNSARTNSTLYFGDALENLFPNASEIMLVLKGGNGNNTHPNYVGWSLDLSDSEFSWNTPFYNANGGGAGNPKAISHWTLYGRGGTDVTTFCTDCQPVTQVPEPSGIALFALAGAGLLLSRKKKLI